MATIDFLYASSAYCNNHELTACQYDRIIFIAGYSLAYQIRSQFLFSIDFPIGHHVRFPAIPIIFFIPDDK